MNGSRAITLDRGGERMASKGNRRWVSRLMRLMAVLIICMLLESLVGCRSFGTRSGWFRDFVAGRTHLEVYEPSRPSGAPPVVLVHGLLNRGLIMRSLAKSLARSGRKVYVYDYQTTRAPVEQLGNEFADYLKSLDEPRLDLVTHSMGGLLARVAFSRMESEGTLGRIHRVVMLGPPNHGSDDATWWVANFPPSRSWIRSLPDLADTPDAAVHHLPIPHGIEIGVVAGTLDRRVCESSTHLATEQDWIAVEARHHLMMDSPAVRRCIFDFLDTGSFNQDYSQK